MNLSEAADFDWFAFEYRVSTLEKRDPTMFYLTLLSKILLHLLPIYFLVSSHLLL